MARTDFYRIAGLAPRATRGLINNLLGAIGRLDLASAILRRVPGYQPICRKWRPTRFCLGCLSAPVLVRTEAQGNAPRTLADIYDQITAWMQEQYAQAASSGCPLTGEHIAGLQRLSHDLLFQKNKHPPICSD